MSRDHEAGSSPMGILRRLSRNTKCSLENFDGGDSPGRALLALDRLCWCVIRKPKHLCHGHVMGVDHLVELWCSRLSGLAHRSHRVWSHSYPAMITAHRSGFSAFQGAESTNPQWQGAQSMRVSYFFRIVTRLLGSAGEGITRRNDGILRGRGQNAASNVT